MKEVREIDLIPGKIYRYHVDSNPIKTYTFTGTRTETGVGIIPISKEAIRCMGSKRIALRRDDDIWYYHVEDQLFKFGR